MKTTIKAYMRYYIIRLVIIACFMLLLICYIVKTNNSNYCSHSSTAIVKHRFVYSGQAVPFINHNEVIQLAPTSYMVEEAICLKCCEIWIFRSTLYKNNNKIKVKRGYL